MVKGVGQWFIAGTIGFDAVPDKPIPPPIAEMMQKQGIEIPKDHFWILESMAKSIPLPDDVPFLDRFMQAIEMYLQEYMIIATGDKQYYTIMKKLVED